MLVECGESSEMCLTPKNKNLTIFGDERIDKGYPQFNQPEWLSVWHLQAISLNI